MVPSALNEVNPQAFSECGSLKRVEFLESRAAPGTLNTDTTVWNTIFRECGVQTAVLPKTMQNMAPDIFKGCSDLQTVLVGRGCKVKAKKFVEKGMKVKKM